MSVSATRSGAKRREFEFSRVKSQPTCAQTRPLPRPLTLSPNRHGECGSFSSSANWWCRRWSATQRIGAPSTAIVPASASVIRSQRLALKAPCVR